MRDSAFKNLSDSAFEFMRLVWRHPEVQKWCGGGQVIPVESVMNDEFTQWFDILAGIDAWQVQPEKGMRGIASRVQWNDGRGKFPYNTFTIRYKLFNGCKTEYEKRSEAIKTGAWAYPYLTCHAYVEQPRREGALVSVAMAKTTDIFEMIDKGWARTMKTNDAEFLVLKWSHMEEMKKDVRIWTNLATTNGSNGTNGTQATTTTITTSGANTTVLSHQPSLLRRF